MSRRRISAIFGTRPEAIKMAPVIRALRRERGLECRICVTAQHREMLDQVLEVFALKPDADLNLMQSGQTLAGFTARALSAIDSYLAEDRPELVLVQGDTTTVFCATLACFYRQIPVGHVEAGLRTGNLEAPWPEEANRVLTSRLAALHFAPTRWSRENLRREGVSAQSIKVTGNTVVDALFLARPRADAAWRGGLPGLPGEWFVKDPPAFVLITGHRRESFGEGFENICEAIAHLARRHPDVHFVYPVHLNPNVREPVHRILGAGSGGRRGSGEAPDLRGTSYEARSGGTSSASLEACRGSRVESRGPETGDAGVGGTGSASARGGESISQSRTRRTRPSERRSSASEPSNLDSRPSTLPNVHLLEPLPYLPFVALMSRCRLVLTDSGGIQEEAPSLGKPVLVMRDTTERPEGVAAGTVKLVGTRRDVIVREVDRLLGDQRAYLAMARARNPYGDGRASERIVKACREFLRGRAG